MTEQHIQFIQTSLGNLLASASSWWPKAKARAEAQANLIERGLTDLNRLADAAEKIGSMELSKIGDLVHIGPAQPTDADVDDFAAVTIKADEEAILGFVGWLTAREGVAKFGSAYEVPTALAIAQEYFAVKGWPTP